MPKTHNLKIASIDIGSNAMRATIATLTPKNELTFLKNYRFPLRLGEDVFKVGRLSPKKMKVTEQAFLEVFSKLSKYNVSFVRACATSALRDAKNAKTLISKIKQSTGIQIELIDGKEEAFLVYKAVTSIMNVGKKLAIIVDIGGGSTEITIIKNGGILASHSFQIGTVRLLKMHETISMDRVVSKFGKKIKRFILKHTKGQKISLCIGTGGNLRQMGKLRRHLYHRPSNILTLQELLGIEATLLKMSPKERVSAFAMRKDRADVIIPAIDIITEILANHEIKEIELPVIGLKEGIIINALPKPPKGIHLQVKGL
jgi:exopolyphosphatase/guanosine-5'-triphosphate,3'-diphosphate pyrophosphatase